MKFDDSLWKGILEDLFADFLRFFFPDADTVFDLKKKVCLSGQGNGADSR